MKVVNAYLAAKEGFAPEEVEQKIETVLDKLEEKGVSFATKEDIAVLEAAEAAEAKKQNTWEYKWATDMEMMSIISASKAAAQAAQ